MSKPPQELIIDLMREKAALKKQVYDLTATAFKDLKIILKEIQTELRENLKKTKTEVPIEYRDNGDYEAEFNFIDESLVFIFHSNIFTFDRDNRVWNLSYVKEHPENSYCGNIFIYNFLWDSFRFNRTNDTGYLIARIFTNREGHFFVEGKRQLGFLYNNFESDILDKTQLRSVVESAILYSLDFELFSPPYDRIQQVTLQDIMSASDRINLATGKRLGFKFQADEDTI